MLSTSRKLAIRGSRPAMRNVTRKPCAACRNLNTTRLLLSRPPRTPDLNSGFTGTYDPTIDPGRGPMFSHPNFGVPQFYPRDLKKRVDDYVVGQDRAKKSICATIFNHYQNVRRRHQFEHEERNRQDRAMRQRLARDREFHQRRREASHPVEGQLQRVKAGAYRRRKDDVRKTDDLQDDYPGHYESVRPIHEPIEVEPEDQLEALYTPEDLSHEEPVKIDKSNILLIGPTGVGKTYILE